MTEKLYYKDAYLKEFTATVLTSEEKDGRWIITLDKTAFFPEEGGQYADTGTIDGIEVLAVTENGGVIYHTLASPVTVGACITGKLNFAERYEKMQSHTAEHILSGLIHSRFGLNNVGFHLGALDVTMDISAPISWNELLEIERRANEIIFENVEVTELYPTPDELASLEYRSKLDIKENVRIVKIGEYDSCACCAPHVKRTGEIGSIKLLDAVKLRGGMRIFIAAGIRAYEVYRKMYTNLAEISRALSVPKLETASAVSRLLTDYEAQKAECKAARLSLFEREAELIPDTEGNLVLYFSDASIEELRAVANKAASSVSGILVLLSDDKDGYKYLISSGRVNLKDEVKKINTALNGKGGGSPSMVQGSVRATRDEIEKYFIQS